MKITATAPRALITVVSFVLGFCALASPHLARAQGCSPQEGFNAVYAKCNNTVVIASSPAFIDAAAWCGGNCIGDDICTFITDAIGKLPAGAGGVVDARGVVKSDEEMRGRNAGTDGTFSDFCGAFVPCGA